MDGLGGLFIAVGGAVAVAAGVFGGGYARHGLDGRPVQAALPLFVLSVLLVPAAGSVGTLLACWELMALTSLLLLVLAEHGRRAEVAAAGRWYAVMTHLGFVAILIGLLVRPARPRWQGWDSSCVWSGSGPRSTPALRPVVLPRALLTGETVEVIPRRTPDVGRVQALASKESERAPSTGPSSMSSGPRRQPLAAVLVT